MQTYTPTTPFGRRSLTLGQMDGQRAAASVDPEERVHKWHVFNDVREARAVLGLTDRALAILSALLTFHPETVLAAGDELVVFPSNAQLMARAYGISPATLRRHLANLVEGGIVVRRDSPNGKRYARKDAAGEIAQAFGFDLKPLVARAAEFAAAAEAVRAERRRLKVARETLTLLRRDIVKLIQFGLDEAVPGDWRAFEERYRMIMLALPRQAVWATIEDVNADLVRLRADIEILLNAQRNSQDSSANESQFEQHIQISNPNLPIDSEAVYRHGQKATPSRIPTPPQPQGSDPLDDRNRGDDEEARGQGSGPAPGTWSETGAAPEAGAGLVTRDRIPLRLVIEACPNIVWVGKGGDIRSWADLLAAADLVRPMLGISPSAWGEAIAVLGPDHAAATLAAIYQRADLIHSAGGYLRNLVTRAQNGQFTVWPMLMALIRAKLDGEKHAQTA